jgi:hypothetical protein
MDDPDMVLCDELELELECEAGPKLGALPEVAPNCGAACTSANPFLATS